MSSRNGTEHFDTVVVGGGQAGLVMGYYLRKEGRSFTVLDAHPRVGDAWRTRWDSLRLFTPAHFSGLPGMTMPGRYVAPTKDEMADYLETYAQRFDIPVRCGVRVDKIHANGDGYAIESGDQRFTARSVIVATGGHHHPWTPPFAADLDPSITQIHSARYRNASQLRDGSVLLVGAGNSGADIAMDLVKTRETWLAGRDVGHVPFHIESQVGRRMVHVVRFAGHHVLTWRTPLGRKALPKLAGMGNPLIRIKPKELDAAGVKRVGRIQGVRDGRPVLADGTVIDAANVIWCTGYRADWSWIDAGVIDADGSVVHRRGITEQPGFYFLGLPFQFAASSDVITGVPRDARYLLKHLDQFLADDRRRVPA